MPIYIVKEKHTGMPQAMVDARLPSQAIAMIAANTLTAEVAKPADLISLTKAGMEVQLVGSSNQQPSIPGAE